MLNCTRLVLYVIYFYSRCGIHPFCRKDMIDFYPSNEYLPCDGQERRSAPFTQSEENPGDFQSTSRQEPPTTPRGARLPEIDEDDTVTNRDCFQLIPISHPEYKQDPANKYKSE